MTYWKTLSVYQIFESVWNYCKSIFIATFKHLNKKYQFCFAKLSQKILLLKNFFDKMWLAAKKKKEK